MDLARGRIFLDIARASEYTGLSQRTLRRIIEDGDLPVHAFPVNESGIHYKFFILGRDLNAWGERGRRPHRRPPPRPRMKASS